METIKLFNKEYHQNCPYYEQEDNRIVEIFVRQAGYLAESVARKIALVFIMKGKISFSSGFAVEKTIASNTMIVLPKSAEYTVRYLEDSRIFVFWIEDSNELCMEMRKDLLNFKFNAKEDYDAMCLEIDGLIRATIELLAENMERGLKCSTFLLNIINQLLSMICAYYPPEKVSRFFAPIFLKDTAFRMSVIHYRNKIFNAHELAKLCNMSYDPFYRHFMKIFGISPKEWITEERKNKILKELTEQGLSLKETGNSCGFANREQFYKFCRKEFGKTAEEIQSEYKASKKHNEE